MVSVSGKTFFMRILVVKVLLLEPDRDFEVKTAFYEVLRANYSNGSA